MHISAQLLGIPLVEIPEKYDEVEAHMLKSYFSYLKLNEDILLVHWNMRDSTYGFFAIELRGELLCTESIYRLPNYRKVDLARLFIKLYGYKYAKHPQFQSLIERNYKLPRRFLSGKEEIEAFEQGEYVKMHQSTSVKVNNMSKLLEMAINGELKTDASWKDTYGLSIAGLLALIKSKWYLQLCWWLFVVVVANILGAFVVGMVL